MKLTKEKCEIALNAMNLGDYEINCTIDEKQSIFVKKTYSELFEEEIELLRELINEHFNQSANDDRN
ncbi:hypothetical protein [Dielma fastidiosa]|uniref:hypothetical protein n=1 Tax=Dielma fastidiosa TaxID=1034346 RepID=UPI003569D061